MAIALITGGNKGLGKATARQLIDLGHTVYIGSRDRERGLSAAKELGAQMLVLDVTDDSSVDAAASELSRLEGKLDVLITSIYERDTLTPAVPGQEVPTTAAELSRYRPSYRCLAWYFDRQGSPLSDDLLGDDRPEEVARHYAQERDWLAHNTRAYGDKAAASRASQPSEPRSAQ